MKKIIVTILLVVLCLGIVGGGIAGIIKLTDSGKLDKKNISKFSYSVGGLDGNGKYKSTNASVYTKDAFECQGLDCSLEFDNNVSYQVYFYDQNNVFVHTTGKLTGAFVKDSVPFFAKYARIVITPNDDDVVTKTEIFKYASQLKVSVNREQGFKNYTENLFDFCYKNKYLKTDGILTDNDESVTTYKQVATTEFVDVSAYEDCLYFKNVPNSEWAGGVVIYCYDSDKNFVNTIKPLEAASVSFVSSFGLKYWNIPKTSFSDGVKYIRMYWQNAEPYPELYCR